MAEREQLEGFVVDQACRQSLLEPSSTPEVVQVIRRSNRSRGIRMRAMREMRDGEMRTTAVEEG